MARSTLSSSAEVKDLATGLERLPSPPAVATRLLKEAMDDSASLERIAKLVSLDNALALRVLKHANAVVHELRGHVDNVAQAVNLLGLGEMRCMVLGIIIRDTLERGKSGSDPYATAIWQHSLACGLAASIVAERHFPRLAPTAFAAGLIHDCGKLALLTLFPEDYEALLDRTGLPMDELRREEVRLFGADHAQVGKWLAEHWNLPPVLVEACWLHHHEPEVLDSVAVGSPFPILLVALANSLAHEVLLDAPGNGTERARLLSALGLSADDLDGLEETLGKRYADQARHFSLNDGEAGLFLQAAENARRRLSDSAVDLERRTSDLARANRVLRRLAEAGGLLDEAKSGRDVLRIVARVLGGLPGTREGCVFRVYNGGQKLEGARVADQRVGVFSGRLADKQLQLDHDLPESLRAALENFPRRRSACLAAEPAAFQAGEYIAVPLAAEGSWLGELLYRQDSKEITSLSDTAGYRQLAAMASAALQRLELAARVEERAESLAHALQRLKSTHAKMLQNERLAAVGQLAAGAAHEINNPLAIISARTQLLEVKEKDERKQEVLRLIIAQIERISTILTDLMDFARPAPPHFGEVDVREVLEKTLALSKSNLEKMGIRVRTDFASGLPAIQGDRAQLEQIFLNLIINAQHAMDKGGDLSVAVRKANSGKRVVIIVADSGIGIPPENLSKIFDPFFTTKSEGKGTGLGLSTTYGIVTSHEGEISVDSEVGKGTTVRVSLPVSPQGASQAKTTVPTDLPAPAGTTVLVVDDEAHIRDVLKESLESEGYTVHVCKDGEEALTRLSRRAYSLLILDIRMPRRGGLSLLSEIRELIAKMPVIVLTGLASHEEIETAMSLGASRFVNKPFQVDALLAEVREVLAAHKGGG